MTLPVLDALRQNYPQAEITVMVSPRPKEIFENSPYIKKLIVYDKYCGLREKIGLFYALKKEKFDMIVDLRNTLFGVLLPARYKTSPIISAKGKLRHMKENNKSMMRCIFFFRRRSMFAS